MTKALSNRIFVRSKQTPRSHRQDEQDFGTERSDQAERFHPSCKRLKNIFF